jgi:hypothetical protein
MLTAVPFQISLTVTINVKPPHHPPASNGLLPDGGVDRLSLPRDVAGKSHIDGKQACHHGAVGRMRSTGSETAIVMPPRISVARFRQQNHLVLHPVSQDDRVLVRREFVT